MSSSVHEAQSTPNIHAVHLLMLSGSKAHLRPLPDNKPDIQSHQTHEAPASHTVQYTSYVSYELNKAETPTILPNTPTRTVVHTEREIEVAAPVSVCPIVTFPVKVSVGNMIGGLAYG